MTNSAGTHNGIEWAPRVRRSTIRRLYQQDARGIVDEALIDEVAYGFFARCRSILDATRAITEGVAICFRCRADVPHDFGASEVLRCDRCGWETSSAAFRRSIRHKQLMAGGARRSFEEYLERLPAARTPRERMLLVDWLVHRLHNSLPDGGEASVGRPAAVNVIGGTLSQVAAMLDELAAVPGSMVGPPAEHAAWRARTWLPPPEALAAAEAKRRERRTARREARRDDGYGKRSSSDSRTISADEPSPGS